MSPAVGGSSRYRRALERLRPLWTGLQWLFGLGCGLVCMWALFGASVAIFGPVAAWVLGPIYAYGAISGMLYALKCWRRHRRYRKEIAALKGWD